MSFPHQKGGPFKVSAARHTSQYERSMLDSQRGLIQGVSDNFDVYFST